MSVLNVVFVIGGIAVGCVAIGVRIDSWLHNAREADRMMIQALREHPTCNLYNNGAGGVYCHQHRNLLWRNNRRPVWLRQLSDPLADSFPHHQRRNGRADA